MCSEPVFWRFLSRRVPLLLVPDGGLICGHSCVAHPREPLSQVTCWEVGQKEVHLSSADGMVWSVHLELADHPLLWLQVLQNPLFCFISSTIHGFYFTYHSHPSFCNFLPVQVVAQFLPRADLSSLLLCRHFFLINCCVWTVLVSVPALVNLVVERSKPLIELFLHFSFPYDKEEI